MNLNLYEWRLESLEARRSSLLKIVDSLNREMEDDHEDTVPSRLQPSVDAVYSTAIQKHGSDNFQSYLEICKLQQKVQLVLLTWEGYACETSMYPLIQELSDLQAEVMCSDP